jgi:hypothetical protein
MLPHALSATPADVHCNADEVALPENDAVPVHFEPNVDGTEKLSVPVKEFGLTVPVTLPLQDADWTIHVPVTVASAWESTAWTASGGKLLPSRVPCQLPEICAGRGGGGAVALRSCRHNRRRRVQR